MEMELSPEIQEIRNKLASVGWGKIITDVFITNIHSMENQSISLQFPVCAIVGENGTGKSTLLKIISCAYRRSSQQAETLFPSTFFPDTIWERITNARIKYTLRVDKTTVYSYEINKLTRKWRGLEERPQNDVYYFDLDRIEPIGIRKGYYKLADDQISESRARSIDQNSITQLSAIMGRQYSSGRYATMDIDAKKEVGILTLPFGEFSEFHQGSGEEIISGMLPILENIPEHSLIIIDEVESSLHPKAQRRFMRRLLYLARIKRLQVVLSTHSPYILSELPPDARILLVRTTTGLEIVYAPSVDFCLSQIDDKPHAELDIAVEDKEAEEFISAIIRKISPEILGRLRIIPVGAADVVRILANLANKSILPYKMMCFVDGDQTVVGGAMKLPRTFSPEKQVISDIASGYIRELSEVLILPEEIVTRELSDVQLIPNYREWLSRLAVKFNTSEPALWTNLVSVWVKNCLQDSEGHIIVDAITTKLNI